MLPRVLEPEVMDSPEEALAYDTMDHTEVNRLFVDDLLQAARRFDVSLDGIILDVGTGTAQIPVELCSRDPDYRVLGIDLAAAMLDLGQARVDAAGLRDQIQLQQHDAKSLPFDDEQFTCVMSNSIVHHIPEPAVVLEQMWRVLRPGGLIFVRDLMRPGDEATLDHLVETYAGEAEPLQQAMFRASLHAALTVPEVQQMVARLGCPAETVQATSDRHWTWAARKEN